MVHKHSKKTTQTNPFDETTNCFKKLIPFSTNLTKLVTNQGKTKSFVISLEAPWGHGKTTFLDMWYTLLKGMDNKSVVKFDAWDADYSDSPFIALISILDKELNKNDKGLSKQVIKYAKKVVKNVIPSLAKFGVYTLAKNFQIYETSKDFFKNLLEAEEKLVDEAIKAHQNKLDAVEKFKISLKNFSKEKQLIILIDELDRCKPTFSIELLEVIKHFFDVENCCFVIAMNHEQMAETVKKRYGHEFDGIGYLERFFDKMIPLPEPERGIFVEIELKSNHFMNNLLTQSIQNTQTKTLLHSFIKRSILHYDLNLREIQKYISDLSDFFSIADQQLFELYFPVISVLIAKKRKDRDPDTFLETLKDQPEETYYSKAMDLLNSKDKDDFNKIVIKLLNRIQRLGQESYSGIDEQKTKELNTLNYIYQCLKNPKIVDRHLATELRSIMNFIFTNDALKETSCHD